MPVLKDSFTRSVTRTTFALIAGTVYGAVPMPFWGIVLGGVGIPCVFAVWCFLDEYATP
jgi:hypothetical protein